MPPLRLTPALVRSLGSPGSRSEHRDAVVTGLALRVGSGGRRMFVLNYSHRGRNHRLNLGEPSELFTLAAARDQAKDLLEAVRKGANPAGDRKAERRRQVLTVGEMVAARIDAAKLRPSTRTSWLQLLGAEIVPTWGARPAAELTRGEVREGLEGIARRSGWTANHAFEVLRWAYARAMEMDLLAFSPCIGVRKPYQGEASQRVLSTLEVRALWRALECLGTGQLADVARLLLLTGARMAMVLGAKAEEFDGVGPGAPGTGSCHAPGRTDPAPRLNHTTDARWTIPGGFSGRSKSGRPHVVPLSPQAVTVVRRRLELAKDGYLFPTWYVRRDGKEPRPFMSWSSAWVRDLKLATRWALWGLRAGEHAVGPALGDMAPWKLHGLRHTIATHLTEDLGRDEALVSLILGHAIGGPAVSRVYNRAERLAERRAALVAWAAFVEQDGERSNVLPMRG